MFGLIGFILSAMGLILFFLPLPLPLFIAPLVSLSGLSITVSQKNPSPGEKKFKIFSIILTITTVSLSLLYYSILYFGLNLV